MIFATRIPDHPAIGNIVAVGDPSARWMYVTHVTASTGNPQHIVYWGRLWSARRQRWTVSVNGCARTAVGRKIPRTPKPRAPQERTTP